MSNGFGIDEQSREIDDIILQTVRSTSGHGTYQTNQMALATAWLEGGDAGWIRSNPRMMRGSTPPAEHFEKQHYPFEIGFCVPGNPVRAGLLGMSPPFLTPGYNRDRDGYVHLIPAMGAMGGHRYTNLHETGHFISNEMNLHDSGPAVTRNHRSECLADGFAISWAVAKGADPVATAQQVGAQRAVYAIHKDKLSGDYFTFPVLQAAVMVGMKHRSNPHPVRIMEDLDREVRRHALAPDLVVALNNRTDDMSPKTLSEKYPELHTQMRGYLPHHTSWTNAQEAQWGTDLITHNPTHAPTLSRLPLAIFMTEVSHPDVLQGLSEGAAPQVAPFLTGRIARMAAGPDRVQALADLAPLNRTAAAYAHALAQASRIFNQDNEVPIAKGLMLLSQATERCTPPQDFATPLANHDSAVPRPFLIVDARNSRLSGDAMTTLAEKMIGKPVSAIAVIHDSKEGAHSRACHLRALSNTFSASLHPMDPERLAEKLPDIQKKVQAGKVWVVGDVPGLITKTPRDQERG